MTITDFLLARIAEDELQARVNLADYEHTTTRRWRRMLAECAAKRAIIESKIMLGREDLTGDPVRSGMYSALNDVLADLARVYADDPDYQPEWAL